MDDIARRKRQGGRANEMVWRLADDEVTRLFRAGKEALRASGPPGPSGPDDSLTQLEHVVDQLAAADDWTRRLRTFCQRLRTESARLALTKLVRLGCVPHELVWCIEKLADPKAAEQIRQKRDETQVHLPRLQELATSFIQLANACDAYSARREAYSGTKFRLDRHVAQFLREEAATMGAFIRDADARRYVTPLAGNFDLVLMMREIKRITGTYQDRLLAQLLNGVSGLRVNSELLRKIRTRQSTWSKTWSPPRYVTRPSSRIVMNGAPHSAT